MRFQKYVLSATKIGTISTGKLADLIVVDGDPVDDITAMYQRPVHVIKDGVLIR